MVSNGGFFKGFDSADSIRGLLNGAENISHTLSLKGLHIAVCYQPADSPADRVSGTVIVKYQSIFRGKQFQIRKVLLLNFLF